MQVARGIHHHHRARVVRRGLRSGVRLALTSGLRGTSGGDALAFKNPDGTIVAVMYNAGAAKQAVVAMGGKMLQFDMPAGGWATINWK
ncbi:glycoside hydrolase family 30 beta sandwich domain-containing protein [Sorangium sp. So ce388]|uniref:glycoside hydrolase family 30 beta sandwich domain-containing protein n=1 Tax=Sorangium sp. So ce388 TaxID=3133309 RepID=UPI003F5C2DB7